LILEGRFAADGEMRVNADEFRNRAAVWRQRAAERHDSRERAADLLLAVEYERLAEGLSAPSVPADRPSDPADDTVGAP